MTSHSLAAEHLDIGYPGRVVGRDLSLGLCGGDVMAVLGPNGSGKTTLFKTILGLLPALRGSLSIDGADVSTTGPGSRAKFLGYVPQISQSFFPYTVREIVLMGRTPHIGPLSAPSARDRERAEAAILRLGLGALADRDFTRISGGERQLALVARALAQDPAFLVMDEPTASLDFANQIRVVGLMRNLARGGLGIIFSTHHPDQALAVATHAALMRDGQIIAAGSADDVLAGPALSSLFGIPLSVESVRGARVCVPVGVVR